MENRKECNIDSQSENDFKPKKNLLWHQENITMEIKEKLFAEKNRLKQGKKQKRRSKKDEIKNRIPLSKKELIKKLKRKRKENRKKKKT